MDLHNDTKKKIEICIAKGFLKLYNLQYDDTYEYIDSRDSPDIYCKNAEGKKLFLEITMTQDQEGDIAVLLNRRKQRQSHHAMCLDRLPLQHAKKAIQSKLCKDYGDSVALVVQDTSPIGWDWDFVIPELSSWCEHETSLNNPFDKGIWIINDSRTNLYKVC